MERASLVPGPRSVEMSDVLGSARRRTLELIGGITVEELERVHSPLMSPLVWDLGHIAAFEDLWIAHRRRGLPLLRPDLMEVYDAFETPRARRGGLPFLRHGEAIAFLDAVRARVMDDLAHHGAGFEHDLVLRHEQQHNETMLQTIELARLEHYRPRSTQPRPVTAPAGDGGLTLVPVPAGPCLIGAAPDAFAYDNERPRHRVEVADFSIGRTAVTNGTWMRFAEGGGYERREWWSDEGWAWKEQYDIHGPGGWGPDGREWRIGGWEPLVLDRPVMHVSWFEADAFARAHDARLPTETEWEKAATWDHRAGRGRRFPWGDDPPRRALANVDVLGFGADPSGSRPGGSSPYGCLGLVGDAWEWTQSAFVPYPGFRADPYREYSEVFFDQGFRVLRGGSWATAAAVATPTFRNWDWPARRQIFSGVRLARSGC